MKQLSNKIYRPNLLMRHFIVLALFFFCLCSGEILKAQTTTITNPVLAGFYPDPSVLKLLSDQFNFFLFPWNSCIS
jgi:hypothetical protein